MKVALAALLLAGCIIEPPDSGNDYPPPGGGGWGSGWGGGGGSNDYRCHADSECAGGLVCARDGECMAASSLRIVRTTWTLKGQAASDASCDKAPKLDISFTTSATGEMFGFSPVPCDAGKFTVDKLPSRYAIVSMSRAGDETAGESAWFDIDGNATINLPY